MSQARVAECVRRWDAQADEDEAADERFIVNAAKIRKVTEDEVRANVEGLKRKTWSRTVTAAVRRFRKEMKTATLAQGGGVEPPKARH